MPARSTPATPMHGRVANASITLEERDLDLLSEEITTLSAHLHAATYRLLLLIEAFDRREGWGEWGMLSCAHWLSWKCGLDIGAAREKVRVARCLPSLPLISASFRRGEVSYSKVRAMTRVATPENEDYLLMIARHGSASHVERLVRAFRQQLRHDERERAADLHAARGLEVGFDDDGMMCLEVRLAPEVGAVVLKALNAAKDLLWREGSGAGVGHSGAQGVNERGGRRGGRSNDESVGVDPSGYRRCGSSPGSMEPDAVFEPPDGPPPEPPATFSQQRADALALVAESFLDHGAPGRGAADRYQVVLHVRGRDRAGCCSQPGRVVDRESMPGHDGWFERATIGDLGEPVGREPGARRLAGQPLPAETARRIACDASRLTVVETEGGEPLSIGRRSRTVPPAIRRALVLRDGGCRFPGCTQHVHVDAHHIVHWADGGATSIDNLVLLCRRHHRLVHEEGFGVRMEAPEDNPEERAGDASGGEPGHGSRARRGRVVFTRPDQRVVPEVLPAPPPSMFEVAALEESSRIAGLELTAETCLPIGYESVMDLDLAVAGVYQASGYSSLTHPPILRPGATVPGTVGLGD